MRQRREALNGALSSPLTSKVPAVTAALGVTHGTPATEASAARQIRSQKCQGAQPVPLVAALGSKFRPTLTQSGTCPAAEGANTT